MVLLCPCIQFPVVLAKSLSNHRLHWNKLIPLIRYNCHPTLFSHTLNRTHPTVVRNRLNESSIQPLDDHIFHYLFHTWIQPFLVLNTRFVIEHELDFVGINTGRDPNNIHDSPTDVSLEPLQHCH